jgi:PAS domain S-box-containing protein
VRQTYEQMLDSISDVYYVTDLDDLLEYISPSAVEMFGFSMDEIIGSAIASYYAPDVLGINSREDFLKAMQEGGGSVRGYQAYMKRKDGSIFPVETNASFRKTRGWDNMRRARDYPRHLSPRRGGTHENSAFINTSQSIAVKTVASIQLS